MTSESKFDTLIALHFRYQLIVLLRYHRSSLLLRFTDDVFTNDTQATIGMDFKTSTVCVDGKFVKLAIWDTAGSERFRTLTPNFYRGAHGVILVYDVTRRETFNQLDSWMKEVDVYSTRDDIVKMLVGNKIDKCINEDDSEDVDNTGKVPKEVSKEEGIKWAKRNCTLFVESSTRTAKGVRDAFEVLVKRIIATPGLWESTSRRNNVVRLNEDYDNYIGDGQEWCEGWCA